MEANNNGNIDNMVKSRLKTSTAKIMAAMGDWNIDAMAPAEAQAISKDWVLLVMWNSWPKEELIADPEATAGPKSPVDPPNPTVSGAVISLEYICLESMMPFFLDKENRTAEKRTQSWMSAPRFHISRVLSYVSWLSMASPTPHHTKSVSKLCRFRKAFLLSEVNSKTHRKMHKGRFPAYGSEFTIFYLFA